MTTNKNLPAENHFSQAIDTLKKHAMFEDTSTAFLKKQIELIDPSAQIRKALEQLVSNYGTQIKGISDEINKAQNDLNLIKLPMDLSNIPNPVNETNAKLDNIAGELNELQKTVKELLSEFVNASASSTTHAKKTLNISITSIIISVLIAVAVAYYSGNASKINKYLSGIFSDKNSTGTIQNK